MNERSVRGFSGADQPPPEIFNRCIRCGLCLPTCPTYLETFTETSGPRGRIALIKAVSEGRADVLADGFVEQMAQCLDCRACEPNCPSGVAYGRLLETARTQIERARTVPEAPRTRRLRGVLLGVFAHLDRLRWAARALRAAQRTRLTALAPLFGLGRLTKLAPRIADRFFVATDQRVDSPEPRGLAFLHVGCVMQVAFPNVHEATMRMLGRASLSVVVPSNQGCCGAIAIHAGAMDAGRELAKRNIVAFERSGADVYVVNAAGCGSALKEYAELFAHDPEWSSRARRFSERVRDVTEVLDASELDSRIGPIAATVTYQEPCHLAHAQRVSGAPRRLLQRIPNLKLVEMDESAVCCGGAGTYNLTQPDMADRLQNRKVANVKRTGAEIVATANPGCAIQVAAGLRASACDVKVRHVVELLDEAYRNYAVAVTRP
ncbi:MAG TPA: heterodisulfide reductase-related iron-sulfur binding cluster [Candidatus Tumulicola sp.]|jgi:glycolate oxidase iron-sulfur subunit